MWLWIPGAPIAMGLLIWVLGRLETRFVEPIQRADMIVKMLDGRTVDEVEAEVAKMLEPYVEQARRSRAVLRKRPV